MKKKLIRFIIIIFIFNLFSITKVGADKLNIYSPYAVTIDAITGEVLYSKNANQKSYPASMTKVLTAILLEEHVEDGEMITVSKNAEMQEGSNGYFFVKEGEKISKRDALYSMMVISANDVSMAVAEHISGSQGNFSKLMNKKIKELGLKNTNFITPNGLHHPEHYTTPYDMSIIAREALKFPRIIKAMGTKEYLVKTDRQTIRIVNKSKIHDNPLVVGGKTGWTTISQNTLVEILQKEKKRVISVVMRSTKDAQYDDINTMANYAFESTSLQKIIEKGEIVTTTKIKRKEIELISTESFYISTFKNKEFNFSKNINIKKDLREIKKGEIIGEIEYYKGGEKIKEIPLISNQEIVDVAIFSLKNFFIAILIPIPIYLIYTIYYNIKLRRRANKSI